MAKPEDPMLVSYRELRRAIGMIGIALPIALVLADNQFGSGGIRDSLSSYYWAGTAAMSSLTETVSSSVSLKALIELCSSCGLGAWAKLPAGIFIGSLCSIGVFLWSYKGDDWDNAVGNVACIAAAAVALFPCSPTDDIVAPTRYVHFTGAAILFLCLAYFCLIAFPRQDRGTSPTPKKPLRNRIYVVCGMIILASIAGIALAHLFSGGKTPDHSIVFWFESAAIWAFGWSWFIKGQGRVPFVQDTPPPTE